MKGNPLRLRALLLTAFILAILAIPAPSLLPAADSPDTLTMSVRATMSGNGSLDKASRFRILPPDGEDKAAEGAIAGEAARILESRGYVRDGERPDILFSMSYQCQPIRIETTAGAGGDLRDERLYVKGSFTETRFSRRIGIRVLAARIGSEKALLWHGEIESAGSCGDTRQDAPLLLEEILGEFPRPTGRPAERTRSRGEGH